MKTLTTAFIPFLIASAASLTAFAGLWSKGSAGGVSYDIYRPTNSGHAPSALMVSLHGCAQTNDVLQKGGNWESAADKYNMTVVLPAVPNGGVIIGCWDYYGTDHNDSSGDSRAVIMMTTALMQNATLMIDPAHVYVSGISSGAGEAFIVGCLRPDIFAGIGLNSTPVLGSTAIEVSGPSETAGDTTKLCMSYAGNHAAAFAVQKTSIIYDSADAIVNPQHSKISSAAMQQLYGTTKSARMDMSQLPGSNTAGNGEMYGDANNNVRVTVIMNSGLGHAWAAGRTQGASGATKADASTSWPWIPDLPTMPFPSIPGLPGSSTYISTSSVDYPMYLGGYFLGI